jgi:two-component system phosphate regulon response regulator PhoB
MARVLVIDDDREDREVLEAHLRRAGHGTQAAATATEGLRLARDRRPDVILVDAALPDMTPAGLSRSLASALVTRGIPIVAMVGKDEEEVPDAIGKPFTIQDILRHIASVLQRARPQVDPTRPIEFGALRVDREQQRVWVAGQEVTLTPLEFKLLVMLHDRGGQVQSRDALLSDVWGISPDVTTRTVDTHVKRLRSKLGDVADYVQTVRGIGYRFASSPGERTETLAQGATGPAGGDPL